MQLDRARMHRSEWTAVAGGLLLVVAVFLPWYGTSDNPNAVIDGARGDFSAWDVHPVIRWLMLAAAAAPLILAWIVLRDHELSRPRGRAPAGSAAATRRPPTRPPSTACTPCCTRSTWTASS